MTTIDQVVVLVLYFIQAICIVAAAWVYLYLTWRNRNLLQPNILPLVTTHQQHQHGSSQEINSDYENGYSWIFPRIETAQIPAATTTSTQTQTDNQTCDNHKDPQISTTPNNQKEEKDPLTGRPCPFCKHPHHWKTETCDPNTTGVTTWIKLNKNDSKLTIL
jgi:hypothetical protein